MAKILLGVVTVLTVAVGIYALSLIIKDNKKNKNSRARSRR